MKTSANATRFPLLRGSLRIKTTLLWSEGGLVQLVFHCEEDLRAQVHALCPSGPGSNRPLAMGVYQLVREEIVR